MAATYLQKALGRVKRHGQRRVFGEIYNKYKNFTMIEKITYINNLFVVLDRVASTEGCVIECGTWRGGMIAGVADVLGPDRHYVLFDSFAGLPPAKEIDGPAAQAWQADKESPQYFDNCTASLETAERAMAMSRARHFRLVEGWFENTLPGFEPPSPIAFLRLDADWFESTMTCLEHLYRYMAPSGIILLDDYYTWDGCSRAVHHFLTKTDSNTRIHQINGICVLMRR
jgi:O-methyltransferase